MTGCLAAAVVATALSGCVSPPSIGEPVEMPDVLVEYDLTGDYPAVWEAPDRLTIVLGGSSSCPTIATRIDEGDGVARVTLHRQGGLACTADLLTVPTALRLQDGRPDAVVLLLDGEEYPKEIVDAR